MVSQNIPICLDDRTTLESGRTKTTSRTVQQKRVYGKKKTIAARAVLEDGSPFKVKSDDKNPHAKGRESNSAKDPVAEVEQRLAAVKIEDCQRKREKVNGEQTIATHAIEKQHRKPIKTRCISPQWKQARPLTPSQNSPQLDTNPKISTKHNTPRKPPATPNVPQTKTPQRRRPTTCLSSACVQDEKISAYCRSILYEAVSSLAAQGVQKFHSWAARSENMFEAVKIAEGSYGEVYKLCLKKDVCKRDMSKSKLSKLRAYGQGVFKIVPLRAQQGAGSKKFTRIDEIAAEVKLLKLLDPIPGFARFREVHVVQGRFPGSLQKAWNTYKQTKDDCMNPSPANKRAYTDNQLWAILEMDDAGVELEKFSWSSVFQVYDIFWGVAMALARAEEFALFEHRDLHLGNICLRSTRSDGDMHLLADLDTKSLKSTCGFGISSLETTIIDYSLSRADLRRTDDPDEKVEIASSDLDGKQIFDANGRDEDEILLRNTYRYMRAQVYTGNSLDSEKPPVVPGIWAEYAPGTNLIWLLFILKNLLKYMKQPGCESFRANQSRQPLRACSKRLNIPPPPFANGKISNQETTTSKHEDQKVEIILASLEQKLGDRLDKVLELLDLENGRDDMCCAADLVAYAIDQRWLNENDFFLS